MTVRVKHCFSAKRLLSELVWRVSDGEQIPSSPVRLHLSQPFGAEKLFRGQSRRGGVNPEVRSGSPKQKEQVEVTKLESVLFTFKKKKNVLILLNEQK